VRSEKKPEQAEIRPMTVLSKYQRLECPGIWHPAADAQRQDVFVSLGEASLIIKDVNDTALAHWSLPAVERLNPGDRPALYRPGVDADELLEIGDDTMIDAIRTVGRALVRARARPGRVRSAILGLSVIALAGLGVWWLPDALTRHTASLMPAGLRGEIGQRLLRELEPYAGRPCTGRAGLAAMATLNGRILPSGGWSIVVVPGGPSASAHLPGRMILVRRDTVEDAADPGALADVILLEAARLRARDPMQDMMADAGLGVTFALLTRGDVSADTLRDHAGRVLVAEPVILPEGTLAEERARAGLDAGAPVLTDTAWLRLQGICEG
jgi:hypothetical protein